MADRKTLAELLLMSSFFKKYGQLDKARKALRDLIKVEDKKVFPDEYTLALALYNLSELFAEQENFIIARDLQETAAQHWDNLNPSNPMDMLWFGSSLSALQQETAKLLSEGKSYHDMLNRDSA